MNAMLISSLSLCEEICYLKFRRDILEIDCSLLAVRSYKRCIDANMFSKLMLY